MLRSSVQSSGSAPRRRKVPVKNNSRTLILRVPFKISVTIQELSSNRDPFYFWIGLQHNNATSAFEWTDGSAVDYKNFLDNGTVDT